MADQEQLDILKQGVEAWNQWRKEHPVIMPDLSYADLSGADLSTAYPYRTNLYSANLSYANLSGVNLSRAELFRANLHGAKLSGANLNSALLREAVLSGAKLLNANLSDANLLNAILDGADLNDANLYAADLNDANLYAADLSGANLSKAYLTDANLSNANLSDANLSGADLSRAILVETNFTGAILTGCSIYGISAWNVKLEGAKQDSLVVTRAGEPTITVDNLEIAQFIYLLLNHKKIRDVFNAVTERGVLLLGRFSGGGLEVLQAIAAKLREESYLPIIFDFERPQDRNYTETIKTLTGLVRFVIADLSGPSVPLELYATIPHFKIPFVPIIEANRKPFAMSPDLLEYPWVVRPPVTFATTEELLEQLHAKVITPAEEKHQARQKLLEELFNQA